MATIKDVAKLARVSLGTVSNVLNGKTNNADLIERVEGAMRTLGYSPDATARSLKNARTYAVGLVIPDIIQQKYSEFVMELEHRLRSQGYSLMVKFSRNNEQIEKKSISSFQELRMDGVILYTTLLQDSYEEWDKVRIPQVVISCQDSLSLAGDVIVMDYRSSLRRLMIEMRQKKHRNVGMIIENELLTAGGFGDIYKEFFGDDYLIRMVDGSKERGFQALFELAMACPDLDGVIVGSSEIGRGVQKALTLLKMEDVSVYALKTSNWIEDAEVYAGELSVSPKKLAKETISLLLDAIERPHMHETITQCIQAQFDQISPLQEGIRQGDHELRFAMYDCSSARSLKMLSLIYEKESGQRLRFDMYPYDELEQILYQHAEGKNDYYDGFMIDITWFDGIVESGLVKNLDHILKDQQGYLKGFVEGAVQDYGMYVESLYTIPFMPGAQILFYQKDLFESRALQVRFQRRYNEGLQPPRTWKQFNAVAEFFTRSYTPESPVRYGVSMSSGKNVYTSIDFLNRLWAYGGHMFDEHGNITINSNNAVNALKNLKISHQFCSDRKLSSWDECAAEFSSGDSAMVILYNSDVGDINNYTKSKVAGNLGYALIPGSAPVQGGWSLGLNRHGKHQEEAERFLLWACGSQNGIPLSILGGSTFAKDYYYRSDLDSLEPWKEVALKSNRQSKKRVLPEILDESRWKNIIYTSIMPKEIMRSIRGEISETEALENIERGIMKLIME